VIRGVGNSYGHLGSTFRNLIPDTSIVEPQRQILRKIAPQFREMTPPGVTNYCCGGGSGFAIMSLPRESINT